MAMGREPSSRPTGLGPAGARRSAETLDFGRSVPRLGQMGMTLRQALHEFISALELSETEREEAVRQHTHLRQGLARELDLDPDHGTFLTGSYARSTAIRPLDDIDVFCVLARSSVADPNVMTPHAALGEIKRALDASYPGKAASPQNRSVNIAFSGTGIAYDVVPAFRDPTDSEVFLIPDLAAGIWIRSNPKIHRARSIEANEATQSELKPLTKAVKHWNRRQGDENRLRSFHLEVMAWDVLTSPVESRLVGLSDLFSGLSERVMTRTGDPARLGPDIDAGLTDRERDGAAVRLREAAAELARAKRLAGDGEVQHAHYVLRGLFGEAYPEEGTCPTSAPEPAPEVSTTVITRAPDGERSRFG